LFFKNGEEMKRIQPLHENKKRKRANCTKGTIARSSSAH